jgi:hypothetical protein
VYADAEPPDLVAPVSPSAERTAAIEKDLWKVEGVTRASFVIWVRSILLVVRCTGGLVGVEGLGLRWMQSCFWWSDQVRSLRGAVQ